MKPKDVKRAVRAHLKGAAGGSLAAASVLIELAQDAILEGVTGDADAIVVVAPQGDTLTAGIVVGSSVLFAGEAYDYLVEYHDGDPAGAEGCIDFCATEAANALKRAHAPMFVPLRDDRSEHWRAFRQPLETADAIRQRAAPPLSH